MKTIKLVKDTPMLNSKNKGVTPWTKKWSKTSRIIVPQGTEVEYSTEEGSGGKLHTVTYRCDLGDFFATALRDNTGNIIKKVPE